MKIIQNSIFFLETDDSKFIAMILKDHINFTDRQNSKIPRKNVEEIFMTYIKRILNTAELHT